MIEGTPHVVVPVFEYQDNKFIFPGIWAFSSSEHEVQRVTEAAIKLSSKYGMKLHKSLKIDVPAILSNTERFPLPPHVVVPLGDPETRVKRDVLCIAGPIFEENQ
jgi:hypothetical protein